MLNIALFKNVTSHSKNNPPTRCHTLSQKSKDPPPPLCDVIYELPFRIVIYRTEYQSREETPSKIESNYVKTMTKRGYINRTSKLKLIHHKNEFLVISVLNDVEGCFSVFPENCSGFTSFALAFFSFIHINNTTAKRNRTIPRGVK